MTSQKWIRRREKWRNSLKKRSKLFARYLDWREAPKFVPASALDDQQTLISVIIPCFNYGKFVVEAIESALNQTIKNVHVIVVDGGSTDGTTRSLLEKYKHPQVSIFLRDGRHLVGNNRNFGIMQANSKYICCLDADDTIEPTYLEKSLFLMELYRYDVVSTSIRLHGKRNGVVDVKEYPDLADLCEGNHVITCAVFKKDDWAEIKGFHDYGIGKEHAAEDWDFWIRLAANGARIRNISREALFNYRTHESGSLSSSSEVPDTQRQRQVILKRNETLLSKKAIELSAKSRRKKFKSDLALLPLTTSINHENEAQKGIMIFFPYLLVGGAERLISQIAEHLVSLNWHVVVISTQLPDKGSSSSLEWFGKSTRFVYQLPFFCDPKEFDDFLAYVIKTNKIDIVLNAGSQYAYNNIKNIKKLNSSIQFCDFLFNTIGHTAAHLKHKQEIDFVIAENKEVANWYRENAGWLANCVFTIANGVNTETYRPQNENANKSSFCIGFVGRMSVEKGPDFFVEIAKSLNTNLPLEFLMVGDGPMTEQILTQINASGLAKKFKFIPGSHEMEKIYPQIDVLVQPSIIDGRPNSVAEALSSGIPVVASNVGGLPEMVLDGFNGFVCKPGCVTEFKSRIQEIIINKNLFAQMKLRARCFAEQNLDIQTTKKMFADLFESRLHQTNGLARDSVKESQ